MARDINRIIKDSLHFENSKNSPKMHTADFRLWCVIFIGGLVYQGYS